MAIDSAVKRQAALSVSSFDLPVPDTSIDTVDRASLLRLYYLVVAAATPAARTFSILFEDRVLTIFSSSEDRVLTILSS